ncbi:aryl hydrocarbon receptor repressor-like [Pontoporia blainvillei]|uniref:Aryl hydrocarbon receptor repressor-like n=1 Tax=Pontoporia blainvillei TaxID=48723 RepID=A0ABX0SDD9_PONBL|nr:aryl hydrocarbon receptor repressor-like [Pontoporia blainvillei]
MIHAVNMPSLLSLKHQTMQFQGKLKFLFGQKRRAPSGAALPPRLSLFCVVAPLPTAVKMQSVCLRAKHRVDASATPDTKAKAAASLCEPELHGKPSYLAGVSSCRDGRGEELGGVPRGPSCPRERRDVPPYSCHLETQGPSKHLNWTPGRHGQDGGTRLKLEPGKGDPFPAAQDRGAGLPYPGTQGTVHAVRGSPGSHQPKPPPGPCASRTSRALRDGHQGQAPLPTSCPFPQESLEDGLPRPGGQRLPAGCYPTEHKLRGIPMPPGAPCDPILSLDVPIKMESESGSEDMVDGYCVSPSQAWQGASDVAKRQLVTFPTRMHLKLEPDSRRPLYSPPLGPGLLGAHPRPGRELAPLHPAHCACLEPPPRLCAGGRQPPSLGCDCQAPGPAVKLEPLDSPPWAAHSQGGAPGMLPRSALATRMPPRDPECTFLP